MGYCVYNKKYAGQGMLCCGMRGGSLYAKRRIYVGDLSRRRCFVWDIYDGCEDWIMCSQVFLQLGGEVMGVGSMGTMGVCMTVWE